MISLQQEIKLYLNSIPIFIGIALLNACLNFGVIIAENLAHNHSQDWIFYIINEITGSFTILLFIPFLFYFFRRVVLNRPKIILKILIYLLISVIFGILYTSIMYIARVPMYALTGIDRLPEIFNKLPYRYMMEYFKQFFSFWIVYLIFWALEQYKKNQESAIRALQLKEELLKSQVQQLQMQIHPHFFFNTLNTISSVMYKEPEKADTMISDLSGFLRSALQTKDLLYHSLEEEINLLKQYSGIMLQRYPDKLSVIYEVSSEAMDAKLPVMLLQPVLENAVKYSIGHGKRTKITVKANLKVEDLVIEIIDNGPGLNLEKLEMGIGLQSVTERLEKLYEERHLFKISIPSKGGTSVSFLIPQEESYVL